MSEFEVEPVRRSMIDPEKMAAIETAMRGDVMSLPSLPSLSEAELRRLRDEIDGRLPVDTLASMDMPSELVAQFRTVKNLQSDVLANQEVPPNQQAQVCNAVASTLQQLVKMQTDFYTAERFRTIENLMIAYMKKLPLADAEAFLNEYEKLGDVDG